MIPTPKEKAVELIAKFYNNSYITNYESIKLALIAVNEIIKQWEYIDTYLANGLGELNPNLRYWYEVRKYIDEY